MPATKTCSTCGSPVPAEAVFCDKCGTRLPQTPACRRCGKEITDSRAQFCDRCGAPLVPPGTVAPARPPLEKGTVCPGCGFVNAGRDVFFCKKCGAGLHPGVPGGSAREAGTREIPPAAYSPVPESRRPVSQSPLQQRPATIPVVARQAAARVPAGTPPATARAPARQVQAPAGPPDEPLRGGGGLLPGKQGRFTKSAGIAAVIVILVIIGILIFLTQPGLPGGNAGNSTENASAPDLGGSLAGIFGGTADNTTAPAPSAPAPAAARSGTGTALNRGVPVVQDTPVTP